MKKKEEKIGIKWKMNSHSLVTPSKNESKQRSVILTRGMMKLQLNSLQFCTAQHHRTESLY